VKLASRKMRGKKRDQIELHYRRVGRMHPNAAPRIKVIEKRAVKGEGPPENPRIKKMPQMFAHERLATRKEGRKK